MAKYIVKRVVMAIITILVVACVTFVLMMSVPGSPFNDEKITPEQKAMMEEKYGLNDPLGVQMLRYLGGIVTRGDFGVSLKMQKDRPVLDIIVEKFPLSASIGVVALLWAIALGIPLGCLAAYNRGKWIDSLLRVICINPYKPTVMCATNCHLSQSVGKRKGPCRLLPSGCPWS